MAVAQTKSPGSFRFSLARSILSRWIRPTVIGNSAEELGLSPTDNICYVLPNRSLADLLVTDAISRASGLPAPHDPMPGLDEDRAFFFLAHAEGRIFKRRSMRRYSARLLRLLDRTREDSTTEVKIVPVSLFWGHAPDQEKSIFRYLLSDNWVVTGSFKKTLEILFHPRHVVVQFSRPISLRQLVNGATDNKLQERKLARLMRVHFRRRRQAILGPDLSHRRTLLNTLLSSQFVQQAIDTLESQGESREMLEKTANRYANEIASHQSYSVVRFFYSLLTWLWYRLYDGVTVNRIDQLRELAGTHGIIYVPCHRSHIDYLLLSYVLYVNGLPPPHIAAGINLNLPLVGALLRRAGAFYMRRSFSNDLLYKAIFDEYIYMMISRGFAIEYFIEGGRSRTGRMLKPRTGMLAMTLRNHLRTPSNPLLFIPVYFGYERIIEVNSYLNELRGQKKKSESLGDLLGAWRILRTSFGKVSVNFGEPLSVSGFLESEGIVTETEVPYSTSLILARRLAAEINKAAAAHSVNLIAAILLTTTHRRIESHRLEVVLEHLAGILRSAPYSSHATITDLTTTEMIREAIKVLGLKTTAYEFGDIISATGRLPVLMTYYRNNISHLLALPSLIARVVTINGECSRSTIRTVCQSLYPFLQSELYLHYSKDELVDQIDKLIDVFTLRGLLGTTLNGNYFPDGEVDDEDCLQILARFIEPALERYTIAIRVMRRHLPQDQLVWATACENVARYLSITQGLNSPQFFDKALFSTFIERLHEEGLIDDHLQPMKTLADRATVMEALLTSQSLTMIAQAVNRISAEKRQIDKPSD